MKLTNGPSREHQVQKSGEKYEQDFEGVTAEQGIEMRFTEQRIGIICIKSQDLKIGETVQHKQEER